MTSPQTGPVLLVPAQGVAVGEERPAAPSTGRVSHPLMVHGLARLVSNRITGQPRANLWVGEPVRKILGPSGFTERGSGQ